MSLEKGTEDIGEHGEEEEKENKDSKIPKEENNFNVDLGRYFDNTTHTIFDEIVSSISSSAQQDSSLFDTLPSSGESKEIETNFDRVCINSNELSHREAWIPSEQTRKVLRTIATTSTVGSGGLGSNVINSEYLTMPGLTLQEELVDPIRKAVIHFLGEEEVMQRNVLTISGVTQDERGLRELIEAGCFRAAVNLTGRLLPLYGQGYGKMNQPSKHSPTSLQLWFTRLALLTKLRLTETLEAESKPFGDLDKPDMYYAFYPEMYGTRRGSMACFAFRLLLAEAPSYCGKSKQALDNLYKVLSVINKMIKNLKAGLTEEGNPADFSSSERDDALHLWEARHTRTLISIVNCALSMKNYVLTIDLLEQLYKSLETHKRSQIRLHVLSAIGRVYLMLGDVAAAEERFSELRRLVDNPDHEIVDISEKDHIRFRELVDRGLTAITQNAFQEAYDSFNTALQLDPSNVMLINNVAVCLLYTGKLEAAIQLLENAVARNPVKTLQESLLLNMSTLYELHTTHSKQSKLHILRQLSRYKGDAIDVQCLKLST